MAGSGKDRLQPNWGAGFAIGIGLGIAFSVALDNWAFFAIGIGLAAAFAIALGRAGGDPDDDSDEPPTSGTDEGPRG